MFSDIVDKVAEPYRSQVRELMEHMKALRLEKAALVRNAKATSMADGELDCELATLAQRGNQLMGRAHALLEQPEAFPPCRRAWCVKHSSFCRVWPDTLLKHLCGKFPAVIDVDCEQARVLDERIICKSAGSMCIACALARAPDRLDGAANVVSLSVHA